jgi:hypothetical protein
MWGVGRCQRVPDAVDVSVVSHGQSGHPADRVPEYARDLAREARASDRACASGTDTRLVCGLGASC